MTIDKIIRASQKWSGDSLAIATVLSTWGSAPCPRGSHMLVNANGCFEGAISGGCVENDILIAANETIVTERHQRRRYGTADTAAWEAGLPCGGEIEILIQPVADTGFGHDLVDLLAVSRAAGEALSISTDLDTGQSVVGELTGQFVNRYPAPRRLIVVGAVQIAQPLIGIAHQLGMSTKLVDPRSRFLTAERFPDVVLDERWPDEAIAAYSPDDATAVVTLSHDTKIDDPALVEALAWPTGYIGALGSSRNHRLRLERFRRSGLSDEQLQRVDGPAGIPINGIGADEIALSIAAGMIAALNSFDR